MSKPRCRAPECEGVPTWCWTDTEPATYSCTAHGPGRPAVLGEPVTCTGCCEEYRYGEEHRCGEVVA